MSCCGDNRKFSCGEKIPAVCVYYKGYLPKYSELDKNCAVIEETTEELYKHQEFILKSIDTSKLTKDCFDYPTEEFKDEEKILVVDVLQVFQDELCALKKNVSGEKCDYIDTSKLDLKCLEDEPCYEPSDITSIIQIMIDKICELDNRVQQLEM